MSSSTSAANASDFNNENSEGTAPSRMRTRQDFSCAWQGYEVHALSPLQTERDPHLVPQLEPQRLHRERMPHAIHLLPPSCAAE